MDAVAARAGVSKATIYAYFKSKEDMFQAVVLDEVNRLRQGIEAIGSGSKRSLTSKLREVGVHLLRVWLSPRTLPLLRILIAEVDRFEEFARAAHRATKEQVICATAQMLDAGVRDGEIVCRDTKKAADLFMCLVGADHMLTALLDPGKTLPCEDFEAHAKWAVEVFLRVYDPRA